MLAAYIHESDSDFGCAVGGLAGTIDSFVEMGREWNRMLADFGLLALHMDQLLQRTGQCAAWDAKRVNSLLEVAAGIIVRRASSVHGYFIQPASNAHEDGRLCAALKTVAACGLWSRQSSSSTRIPIIFDELSLSQPALDARIRAASAEGILERYAIGSITAADPATHPVLQAAALVAEECRQEFRAPNGRAKPFRPFQARSGRGKPSFHRLAAADLRSP